MSIFDDNERRGLSLADALSNSLWRKVFPLIPAFSEPPTMADQFTQSVADEVVDAPAHWLSLGYGTDFATPVSQDLFNEALQKRKSGLP
jgi:hypothetical protein